MFSQFFTIFFFSVYNITHFFLDIEPMRLWNWTSFSLPRDRDVKSEDVALQSPQIPLALPRTDNETFIVALRRGSQ